MDHIFGFAFLFIVLLFIGLIVLTLVANWQVYKKAGRPGWASIVPFYNTVILLEMVNAPFWWILMIIFVPIANIVFLVIVMRRLAKAFGQNGWFTAGLILLPFIFYPILAFGTARYVNNFPPAPPMSKAILWTLIAAGAFMVWEGGWIMLTNQSDSGYRSQSHYTSGYDDSTSQDQ